MSPKSLLTTFADQRAVCVRVGPLVAPPLAHRCFSAAARATPLESARVAIVSPSLRSGFDLHKRADDVAENHRFIRGPEKIASSSFNFYGRDVAEMVKTLE